MAFAYFVVFPLALAFCQNSARKRTDSDRYHQIPRFCHGALYGLWYFFRSSDRDHSLVLGGCNNTRSIEEKRPYVFVGAFVVGMLLTPPDVLSQTLLAIPMYLLFEVGVFFARFYTGKQRRAATEEDEGIDSHPKAP